MIEPAKKDDVPAMVELGRLMVEESPRWRRLRYSPERVGNTLTALIESPSGLVLIARRQGLVVGGIVASVGQPWLSDELVAEEHVLFMHPQYRASIIPARLIAAMVAWAKGKGCRWVEAGIASGVHPERTAGLYKTLGFIPHMVGLEHEYGN
ncbi:GNAT family N-acetyltransferase [Bordetella avium]|uniref:GNAT family N-acetyltransferase n=1 Tax=Bordetella avium TaxID=521 RepID=UPI000E0BFCD0|nr:GNAT family N-acetyltransferase [Bordetella avium]RIQ11569.1 GNAT family N-acetyltransferase [Bordetella avium]RIQ44932.1 GNAT family N-acetyltransferase [Bordetella avium]RIQ49582.1 GNAT family N-acetyltransferase [Bordetella avium]RIQ55321.1 GNAT family N-acetyltransferase [Bordetella avium]RIQ58427.1 GNAT family N-acetyltransferase [Bordetella avium]